MFRSSVFAAAILAISVVPVTVWAAPYYSVTDLGTHGGSSSFGRALNEAGEVVGWFVNGSGWADLEHRPRPAVS